LSTFKKKLDAAKKASTAHLLIKCSRLLNDRAIASFPPSKGTANLRAAHLALFPHIDLGEGTRLTELAARLGITKQAVGQLVDDLEAEGMVDRVPDPNDQRAKRVIFTNAGKTSILEGLQHLKSLEPELNRALGREVVESLHSSLLALHGYLEK
jgi:DNA-binding MarR family transcriptional regulator